MKDIFKAIVRALQFFLVFPKGENKRFYRKLLQVLDEQMFVCYTIIGLI